MLQKDLKNTPYINRPENKNKNLLKVKIMTMLKHKKETKVATKHVVYL